jgi:hypothetical protein
MRRAAPARRCGRGWLLLAALAAGCHLETLPPTQSGLAEHVGITDLGAGLRVRVRAMAGPDVAEQELAADEAARNCPAARAGALAWKIQAVPSAQDALFQTDPLVALADGWAFAVQQRNFLRSPRGRAELGACSERAAEHMQRIAERARAIVAELASSDGSRAHKFVEDWAVAHPLQSLALTRTTIVPALAAASARKQLGALAAVGTMVETLDDLTDRIAAYRETLLKEARWTAELAVVQAGSSDLATTALEDAGRLTRAADRMSELAARMPQLIDRERDAALAAVREERKAVMAEIDRQRVDTLASVRAGSDDAFARMDKLSRDAIDQGGARAEALVDRAFLRVAQLLVALAVVAVIAILSGMKVFHIPVRRRA